MTVVDYKIRELFENPSDFTEEHILNGEPAEPEITVPQKRDKREFYLRDEADPIIQAYAEDLGNVANKLYAAIEEVQELRESVKGNIENNGRLVNVENVMDALQKSLDEMMDARKKDISLIRELERTLEHKEKEYNQLQDRVKEQQEEVSSLREDIEGVLRWLDDELSALDK